MSSQLLDDFEDLAGWTAVASGQAQLRISQDQGLRGKAMRLDFNFKGGGGFVVARKEFHLMLPESYHLSCNLRGSGLPNKFEFKLASPEGYDVWWFHRDRFEFPADWQPLQIRSSQIEFAWGPAGGGSPKAIGALEFAIAAGPGGIGTLWIEDLRFEDDSYRATPQVQASSALPGFEPACVIDGSPATCWRSASAAEPQWLLIDFQQEREYGGLIVQWTVDSPVRDFEVQTSNNGNTWRCVYSARTVAGERSYLYLPDTHSRYLRLQMQAQGSGGSLGIIDIAVKPFDFSRSITAFFEHIARHETRGHYPKYWYGEQSYWSPAGTLAENTTQALLNEEGLVEVDQGAFSMEPFLYLDGKLITWADVSPTVTLERDCLPIPSSTWRWNGMMLQTTAFASGHAEESLLFIRYRIKNTGDRLRHIRFFAAIRPFQVTPPWQSFLHFGGVSPVRELVYRDGAVMVNGAKIIIPLSRPDQFGAVAFDQGNITHYLKTGDVPAQTQVDDGFGYASGALQYEFELAPASVWEGYFAIPFGSVDTPGRTWSAATLRGMLGSEQFENAVEEWNTQLGLVRILLPASARVFVDTFKSAVAHILVNRNGPALQPGPRRYTRSWIRDGAVMAAALLRMDCILEAQAFIRWYAQYQAPDGNVPCCVDHRGPDWLAEYDSLGEFIYTVMECYRFSGDRGFLQELWSAVVKAVDYLEELRNRRLTLEYQMPDKNACYGLLPESASHEGYLAHPVHAYWDDFWALRGLADAAAMADLLEDTGQMLRMAGLHDSLQETLYASIQAVMAERHIPYIPGSVEWADFDPTATANAIALLDQLGDLPADAMAYTFDEYLAGLRRRHSGESEWANYTPYEVRIIGALVRLGRRNEAYQLAELLLADRRPPAWNQWPEIAWRNPRSPGHLGDLPHTWIAAEYLLSFRTMLAYERFSDGALVLAAGVPAAWLRDDFQLVVNALPTYYGWLNYSLRQTGDGILTLTVFGDLTMPPGRIIVKPPLPGPLTVVTVNGNMIQSFDAESVVLDQVPAVVVMQCRAGS